MVQSWSIHLIGEEGRWVVSHNVFWPPGTGLKILHSPVLVQLVILLDVCLKINPS